MERRFKRFLFSDVFLRQSLLDGKTLMAMFEAMPIDFKVISFGNDYSMNAAFWIIESQEFDEVEEGTIIPEAVLEATKDGDYLRFRIKTTQEDFNE